MTDSGLGDFLIPVDCSVTGDLYIIMREIAKKTKKIEIVANLGIF